MLNLMLNLMFKVRALKKISQYAYHAGMEAYEINLYDDLASSVEDVPSFISGISKQE